MKKTKLLLSLSLMCLSIAVLCFGVFSALSVSYSISGTINYEITDVFAKINTKVFKVAGVQDSSTMQTNVDTLATTKLDDIAGTTYIDSGIEIAEYDSESTSDDGTRQNVKITLDSTYMTYYVVINVANQASEAINAQLTDNTTYTNLNTANKLIQNGIAKDETKNLVVAFSVADKTTNVSVAIDYSVEVSYTKYFRYGVVLTDDTNMQFYMNLGTYNGEPIRWNMVSADGTTKYDSTNYATNKTDSSFISSLKGKAIFVQNRYTEKSKFNDSTSNGNTYNGSVIQTYLKGLETFGSANAYGITTDPGCIASYTTNEGGAVEGDKFWLLSRSQAETFFADDASRRYYDANGQNPGAWWLRSPNPDYSNQAYSIRYYGTVYWYSGVGEYNAVRAAFQLA